MEPRCGKTGDDSIMQDLMCGEKITMDDPKTFFSLKKISRIGNLGRTTF